MLLDITLEFLVLILAYLAWHFSTETTRLRTHQS